MDRPAIPHAVKMAVCTRQAFKCACGCGNPLLFGMTQFDHRPALMNREYNLDTHTFTPDANDPLFIEAVTMTCHALRTFGPGGEKRITTRGSDIGEKARERAMSEKHRAHRDLMAAKECGQPRKLKNTFGRRPAKVSPP